MISIIIPVYKAENYLRQCLDSILQQTYTDWEALLIDDGSPDNSGSICDEYAEKDARFKVFHIPNGGVSNARNVGLDHAQGEYVMFIDSDDWIDNNTIETCLGQIKANDLDLLQFGALREHIDGTRKPFQILDTKVLSGAEMLRGGKCSASSCLSVYRRSIIEEHQHRYLTTLWHGEDYYFNLSLLRYCKKTQRIPNAFYHYREHSSAATTKKVDNRNLIIMSWLMFRLALVWPPIRNLALKNIIGNLRKIASNILHSL